MKAREIAWILVLVLLVVAMPAGLARAHNELGVEDSGSTVELTIGDQLVVGLPANPTTGYSWQLAESLDEAVLQVVDSHYERDESLPPVGGGGQEHWTFVATGPGEVAVTLFYVRPWEHDVEPAQTWTVWVVVRGPASEEPTSE